MRDLTWLYLPSALLLGMAHALEPGHSKTVVASYLISVKGTPRDAVWLGLTVTVTHTIVVFALALGALALGAAFPMERIQHWLEVVSSLLVFVMGLWLLISRLREWRREREHTHSHKYVEVPGHDHGHFGHKHPDHGHSHTLPTSQRLSFRQLLGFGLSGGVVPCPAALAILILAVGIGKPMLGLATVVVFSIGLAITLIGIGIAVCRGTALVRKRFESSAWLKRLPVLSSLLVTILGLGMLARALNGRTQAHVK